MNTLEIIGAVVGGLFLGVSIGVGLVVAAIRRYFYETQAIIRHDNSL